MTKRGRFLMLALACVTLGSFSNAHADALLGRRAPEIPLASTREFTSDDLQRTQRLAIAALQDLGFVLESADAAGGTLTASRLDAHALRMSIALSATSEATLTASVTMDYAGAPVADPRAAEAFFDALAAQLASAAALE